MADALMFRMPRKGDRSAPVFITPVTERIEYWRWLGWVLLADEREIRRADVDDARREDEKGRR